MSVDKLKAATAGTQVASKEPQTFPQFLKVYGGEIARALPKHLNADRMGRIALTEFRKTPKLADCDPRSVFAAVIMLSQLGLEPGVLGQGFLVPYGTECQAIPGWKGLVDLVTRTGRATVDAQSVYEGDEFDWQKGTDPYIRHKESGIEPEHRADFKYVYAVGWVKGAQYPKFEIWTRDRVVKHRDRFNKVGKKHYSFEHFEQYAKKVVLLQVLKYMPASPELQTAIQLEHATERGSQGIDLSNVVDGSWAPTGGEAGSGSQDSYSIQYSDDDAAKALKESGSGPDLEKAWAAIALDYEKSGRQIPPDIDELYKARKKELTKL